MTEQHQIFLDGISNKELIDILLNDPDPNEREICAFKKEVVEEVILMARRGFIGYM